MNLVSRISLIACLSLLFSVTAAAQDPGLSPEAVQRLDGEFQVLLQQPPAAKSGGGPVLPLLSETAIRDAAGTVRYPAIIRTDDAEALTRAGIPLNAVLGPIATARLTPAELRIAAGIASVQRIEPAGLAFTQNDEAAREVGARTLNRGTVNNTAYTGRGVLTCVIDSGIDVDHGDFMDADGNTRIQYVWDQTEDTAGQSPEDRSGLYSGLNYGTEYTAADIDAESATTEDINGHGTHVAGTVASTGNALVLSGSQTTPEHRGMAPEADLIVVKAGVSSFTVDNIINAMSYCSTVADEQGKPLVINMSLGSSYGPHDGTRGLSLAVDAVTDGTPANGTLDPGTAPDRIVVISAGNSGSSRQHVSGTLDPGVSNVEPITIQPSSPLDGTPNDYIATQKWFDGTQEVTITVTAPNGTDTATLTGTGTTTLSTTEETPAGAIYLESGIGVGNGDRYFDVQIFDYEDTSVDPAQEIVPESGTWLVEIENGGSSAVTYHGWAWRATLFASYDNGNDAYTIGSPGSATGAITVGSHVHRWYWGTQDGGGYGYGYADSDRFDISSFSSRGPRRDGVQKPELTAPGQAMLSAASQDMSYLSPAITIDEDGMHRRAQGTSMASPVVAGSVALLLQAAREQGTSLTANEVRALLTAAADADAFTDAYGTLPNEVFGHGKLDILDAVVTFLGGSTEREILSPYATPGNTSTARLDLTASTPRIAARFQPSVDGFVTGATVSLWEDAMSPSSSAIQLTGPLAVEIWSDDGSGFPDAKLGSTVTVPVEQLNAFTPNAIDLADTGVNVVPGTDYHLVLAPTNASDALYLTGETTSVVQTSVFDGATWAVAPSQLQASIEVARVFGLSSALPVELSAFHGRAVEDAVMLEWSTASETNNDGFFVERRTVGKPTIGEATRGEATADGAGWTRLGFVDGSGTTSEPQRYTFRDAGIPFGASALTYRLRQVDVDGTPTYTEPQTVTLAAPRDTRLHAPFPNPASTTATIPYELPADIDVRITVYDVLGRRVHTIADAPDTRGEHTAKLSTDRLAPGMYFIRLEAGTALHTQRLAIVR